MKKNIYYRTVVQAGKSMLLLLFFLFITTTVLKAQEIDDGLLVASLERTSCYGNCPYYTINVYSNGIATYEGKKHVENIGWYKAEIKQDLIESLIKKAKEIKYMDLGPKYPVKGLGIIDFPVCITTVVSNKKKKIIYSRNDSPQRLVQYQEFFDESFENIDWKKFKK